MSISQSRVVSPLSSYVYFDVFRHRYAGTTRFRDFITDIPKICQSYGDQPYASLADLAQVSAMPLTVTTLGKLIKSIPHSPRPGLFCSQLVASVFAAGGFPLTQGPPARARPEDLARATSLECITPNTRVLIAKNAELRTYSEFAAEAFPDFQIDSAELAAIMEGPMDFGRTTRWFIRDSVDEASEHSARMNQLIASVDGVPAMAARILKESREADGA